MHNRDICRMVATAGVVALAMLAPLSGASASEVAPTPEVQENPTITLDDLRDSGSVGGGTVGTPASPLLSASAVSTTAAAGNTTWQRTYTRTWKDAGVTLATHKMGIAWTGDGKGKLLASPKSVTTDVGTALLVSATNKKSSWDWYSAGQGGTGQGNSYTDVVLGVPTKWGNIGATQSSRIQVQVNGYGGAGLLE